MIAPIDGRKIFGVGLNKTGTTSLGEALNLLGIRAIHYPFKKPIYDELTSGCFRLSILERYQAIVDTPVAPYYPQLDAEYPGSRFVLTLREPESWLRSIDAHWPVMRDWCRCDPQFGRFTDFISAAVYGCLEFDRDRFLYAYETHTRNVLHYFRDRPDDLLVMDICRGDGWEQLCPFLGVDVPDVPFPHSNQGKRRGNARRWIQSFDAAKRELAEVLSAEDRVILVDDGTVGEFLVPAARAFAFPERDGAYAGPPETDSDALHELERMRNLGARYLVLTWASFWWFDHYGRFRDHLRANHRCVLENERVIVFELTAPRAAALCAS